MSQEMLRWLRLRILYFLYSSPSLYELGAGDHATFSLCNECPHMSTNRDFSRNNDGPHGSRCVKIRLRCTHDVLDVLVNFECRIFVKECGTGPEVLYDRVVYINAWPVQNDGDDFAKALRDVLIPCDYIGASLHWTLPQHANENQIQVTLNALDHCGCGASTLLWMRQQFAIFLNAPSSEAQRVYEAA